MNQIEVGHPFPLANPFAVESPEKLSPEMIVDLFIERFTEIETIRQRKHTFIWGSRGSGKSMMLRYLEPQCQRILGMPLGNTSQEEESFIAFYIPIKEGQINQSELSLLSDYAVSVLTEHMLNLIIAKRVIETLHTQFPDGTFNDDRIRSFAELSVRLLSQTSSYDLRDLADTRTNEEQHPFEWLLAYFASELSNINRFLRRSVTELGHVPYEGSTSGYHDFLLPFLIALKRFSGLENSSVYLLIDDADKLTAIQQKVINTWMANRDQHIVCIKVSAKDESEYKTYSTKTGGLIEQPHDYSIINIDELYTRSKSDYASKVTLIANKRLELSDVPTKDIVEFLPTDSWEDEQLRRVKQETSEEWVAVGRPGRRQDYITRYSKARLFQFLKDGKHGKSYAGFQNLVDISSGVVREFLEPCYLMYQEFIKSSQQPTEVTHIPPSIQNAVIKRYSEDFLLAIEDLRKDVNPDDASDIDKLRVLIESLGRLFYSRLHDREAREARLFSFTIRDQEVPPEISAVLDLGVANRYFQLRTYPTKEGGGREKWYILNRRLCPVYKLDPSGFEGRISLTASILGVAISDSDKFVSMRLKQRDTAQESLFDLEEEPTE